MDVESILLLPLPQAGTVASQEPAARIWTGWGLAHRAEVLQ
jgi:hypothetical protein